MSRPVARGSLLDLDEPPFQIVKNKNKVMLTRIDYIVSYNINLSGQWTSNIDHGHVASNIKEEVVTMALIIFIETVMNNKSIYIFFYKTTHTPRAHTCIQTPFYKTLPTVLVRMIVLNVTVLYLQPLMTCLR